MAYYRNRATGKVQFHPKSGLGETFNAEEIADTGKPVKPRTSLAPSKQEIKVAKDLMKDKSATPLEIAAAEAVVESSKTTEAKTGTGDHKKDGDQ